jgi:virulence factor Mce-like protein
MSWLKRFEIRPGQHRPHHRRNGAVAIAVVAVALMSAYKGRVIFLPQGGETVKAEFVRTPHVRVNTTVRVAGVDVGRVSSIERVAGGRGVRVSMRIEDGQDIDLRADARAALYERTLLGRNMYIELSPGSPSAPPLGGKVIERARTTSQVDIDEVLQPLEAGRRRGLQRTVAALSAGLSGPAGARRAIAALPPAARALARGLPPLRGPRAGHDLPRLVADAQRAARALDRDQEALAGLIDGADVTLGVTSARRADLAATLDISPAALADTRATTTRLRTTLDEIDPIAERLRPGARRLAAAAPRARVALARTTPLLIEARPLLERLNPTLRRLGRTASKGSALIDGLDPTLERASDDLVPWLDERDAFTGFKNYEILGPTVAGADSATSPFDRYGHSIVFEPSAGPERVLEDLPCQLNVTNPDTASMIKCQSITAVINSVLGGAPPPSARLLRHRAERAVDGLDSDRIRALRRKVDHK